MSTEKPYTTKEVAEMLGTDPYSVRLNAIAGNYPFTWTYAGRPSKTNKKRKRGRKVVFPREGVDKFMRGEKE